MMVAPNIMKLDKLDVIGFLSTEVKSVSGLLIDAYLHEARAQTKDGWSQHQIEQYLYPE